MSDPQSLLLVLVLIYLVECAGWLRRGSVAFLHFFRWRLFHPGAVFGNSIGGLLFAHPLPPLGFAVIARQWPVSLSPEGAFAYVAQAVNPGWRPPHEAKFIHWEEIKSVTVDAKKVLVNGAVFVRTDSAPYARHLADLLRRLVEFLPAQRAAAIKKALREGLDPGAVQRRFEVFQQRTQGLRWRCNLLFVVLFVLAPALVWRFGLRLVLPALLAGLAGCVALVAMEFYRQHRRLFPESRGDLVQQLLPMALAPPAAIRAHDLLARHCLAEFHPLAVAQALCPRESFRVLARRVLLDLRHPMAPICPVDLPGPRAAEAWFRAALLEAVEEMLRRVKVDEDELTRPPARVEECQSYCPRCDAQFAALDGTCADCGGLPLLRFDA